MSLIESLFSWVWQTSLITSLLVLLVLAIEQVWDLRIPARLRYLFSLAIVLRLLLPMVPESALSIENLYPGISEAVTVEPAPRGEDLSLSGLGNAIEPETGAPGVEVATSLGNRSSITDWSADPTLSAESPRISLTFFQVLSLCWMVMAVASLLRLAWQYRTLRRVICANRVPVPQRVLDVLTETKKRMAFSRPVDVCVSRTCSTAALVGLFKPMIVLPERGAQALSQEALGHIFLHELTHLKRGDNWLNVLCEGLRALHWFNPVIHIGLTRFRADREILCDALVLERLSTEEHTHYGETLIALVQQLSGTRLTPVSVPVVNHKIETIRRIKMITKSESLNTLSIKVGFSLLLAACCVPVFTAAQAAEEKQTQGDIEAKYAQQAAELEQAAGEEYRNLERKYAQKYKELEQAAGAEYRALEKKYADKYADLEKAARAEMGGPERAEGEKPMHPKLVEFYKAREQARKDFYVERDQVRKEFYPQREQAYKEFYPQRDQARKDFYQQRALAIKELEKREAELGKELDEEGIALGQEWEKKETALSQEWAAKETSLHKEWAAKETALGKEWAAKETALQKELAN